MSNDYIGIPPDSYGKKVRTNVRTVGGTVMHEHLFGVVDHASGNLCNATYPLITRSMSGAITHAYATVVLTCNASVITAATFFNGTQKSTIRLTYSGNNLVKWART